MSVLELRHATKRYGDGADEVYALRGVDLAVEAGELVAVMGPSGSGKSTLLTIAGSLETPTDGQVLLDGVDMAGLSHNERARMRRRSIGYVFQDYNLLAGLTAAENVSLPLELDGVAHRSARGVAVEALEGLGLGDRADRFPDQLSGGEPSGALDSANGEAVMRLIRNACRRDVAGVVVTHDAQLAAWADRIVFLRDGRLTDATSPLPGPEVLLADGRDG